VNSDIRNRASELIQSGIRALLFRPHRSDEVEARLVSVDSFSAVDSDGGRG
jgi:hypothetical protein